jgi:hypothetical protein
MEMDWVRVKQDCVTIHMFPWGLSPALEAGSGNFVCAMLGVVEGYLVIEHRVQRDRLERDANSRVGGHTSREGSGLM